MSKTTWARLDDGFYDHDKVLDALEREPTSIGLHARALSFIAKHERDGRLSERGLAMLAAVQPNSDAAVEALVEAGLWHRNGKGYVIHDYLDYNLSREQLTEKRKRDRERKRGAGSS